MKRARLALVLGVVVALGFARALRADAPAGSAAPAPSAALPRDERLERRLERLREHAMALASAWPTPSVSPTPSGSAGPPDLAAVQQLAQRWAERLSTRLARREQHQAELRRELGDHATNPALLAELKLHAQRVSDLARLEFLAKNARSGQQQAQLLARIGKLLQREATRHHAQMTRLLATAPGRSLSPAPSASGAAP